ncbi:hypothetical protein GCM10028785_13030 [Hydrogenophaga soli]
MTATDTAVPTESIRLTVAVPAATGVKVTEDPVTDVLTTPVLLEVAVYGATPPDIVNVRGEPTCMDSVAGAVVNSAVVLLPEVTFTFTLTVLFAESVTATSISATCSAVSTTTSEPRHATLRAWGKVETTV